MSASALVLVAHQPAYLPWPGYLSRLTDLDRMLVLDHVQYSGSWQNRNYVDGPHGRRRLTVPVTRRFGQAISEARIADDRWRGRHLRTLEETYHRAQFWPVWAPRLAALYGHRWERLADLNQAALELLLDGFGIGVTLVRSSDLQPRGRKTQMLIDLCRITGSTTLRVGSGAYGYLNAVELAAAGIGVEVATYTHPPYQRGGQPFKPGLSALDLLLHQGPAASRILVGGAHTASWSGAEVIPA